MGAAVALKDSNTEPIPPPPRRRTPVHVRAGDEQLARAVARGRGEAFAELYRRHHQALYRYCRSILHDDEDARDALQSAMTKAFAALRRRERDLAVRPWLFRIVHNEAITLLRRRKTQATHVERLAMEAVARQGAQPEHTLEQRERIAALLEDLAALSPRQRAALLMRELNGLSIAEIAGALAITPGAAKQALFEARGALKDLTEGRSMDCESVQRLLDDHDGRVLRGRFVRSHLRSCASCRELERAIAQRRADLSVLAPPLPAAAGGALLARVLAGAGVPHGATVAAGAVSGAGMGTPAAGAPSATVAGSAVATGGGVAGGAGGGVASGGAGGGLAGALGGSVAAKGALGAAIVLLVAGGAAHVFSGDRRAATGHAPAGAHRRASDAGSTSTLGARPGQGTTPVQRGRHRAETASGPNGTAASAAVAAGHGHGSGAASSSVGLSKGRRAGPGAAHALGPATVQNVKRNVAKREVHAPRRAGSGPGRANAGAPRAGNRSSSRGSERSHGSHTGAAGHRGQTGRSQPGGKTGSRRSPQTSARSGLGQSQAGQAPQSAGHGGAEAEVDASRGQSRPSQGATVSSGGSSSKVTPSQAKSR